MRDSTTGTWYRSAHVVYVASVQSAWARDVWHQNRSRNRSQAAIFALLTAFTLTFACVGVAKEIRKDEWAGAVVLIAVLGAGSVCSAAYARGSARAAFKVTSGEVILRNPLRTTTVPINEVARFVAGEQPQLIGSPGAGVLVELRDGRSYPIRTLGRDGFVWNTKQHIEDWSGVADDLNALLRD